MTISQLALYNNALRLIGERELADLTEAREPRFRLDGVWDLGAVAYCLEVIKPRFACTVSHITTPTTSTEHAFTSVFTLPADYVALAGVFSNSTLDEPINRYIVEGRTIACNHDEIYLRYVRDPADFTVWTPTFAQAVSGYLAKEIASRLTPDRFADIVQVHTDRFKVAIELNGVEEPMPRAKPATASLSQDWLYIYNDALFIMGLPQLITVDDDSNTRAALDAALSTQLVLDELEDTGWEWANTSTQIQYNPSVEPSWGYRRAFDKPADVAVLSGLFCDEYMQHPLKNYSDEGSYFFADVNEMYVKYVATTLVSTPSAWPAYFRRLISANLARRCAAVLSGSVEIAMMEYASAQKRAKANDLRNSPPRRIQNGTWTTRRLSNEGSRNRP